MAHYIPPLIHIHDKTNRARGLTKFAMLGYPSLPFPSLPFPSTFGHLSTTYISLGQIAHLIFLVISCLIHRLFSLYGQFCGWRFFFEYLSPCLTIYLPLCPSLPQIRFSLSPNSTFRIIDTLYHPPVIPLVTYHWSQYEGRKDATGYGEKSED